MSAEPTSTGSSKRRKRDDADKDVDHAVESLESLLTAKSKELEEREAAFEKRVRLFEQDNPQAGKESDTLKLNIGGSTKITVTRRVLTHFGDSMLASKFSGRWDHSLEKDEEGNFFLDFDAEPFIELISYLRLCAQKVRDEIEMPVPAPTFEFCSLLEYYDLMPAVRIPS